MLSKIKKVLIVEDNASNADMAASIFKEDGYQTMTLLNANNIINILLDFRPDVVLTDILLEDADGRELCNMIKSDFRMEGIIVILMTAALMHNIPEIPCCPDYIVTKPFDIYELSEKVRTLLMT